MVSAGRIRHGWQRQTRQIRTTDREFLAPSIFHFAATQNEANHAGVVSDTVEISNGRTDRTFLRTDGQTLSAVERVDRFDRPAPVAMDSFDCGKRLSVRP